MSVPRCRNCDAPLTGRYCCACGQRDRDLQLTIRHVLHDATREFLHVDGKILQTLELLALRPGALAVSGGAAGTVPLPHPGWIAIGLAMAALMAFLLFGR